MEKIETDYFIVGAGAAAMAFADTLLSETDARIAMVDRRDRPGGHWNDAYSFVRLHQPAAFYGVNSRPLGELNKEESNINCVETIGEDTDTMSIACQFGQAQRPTRSRFQQTNINCGSGRQQHHPSKSRDEVTGCRNIYLRTFGPIA